uniref:inorganic diphosphatase n=1 Tax=viral metagenome TaxID=1070528 RepID=A0A6C0LB31_9ZZZZ
MDKSRTRVVVYVEIEKHSNIKYEYCKKEQKLVVDRILPYPFFYPHAYGFIPNTMAPDNDELDILILTDATLKNNTHYTAYIIGALKMDDEKGEDDKILCVLEEEIDVIKDIYDVDVEVQNGLFWFFSNYKSSTPGKWSNVKGFVNKENALQIYETSLLS